MAWDEKLPGNVGIRAQESWFADGSAVRFRADDGEVDRLFGYEPTAVTYAKLSAETHTDSAGDVAIPVRCMEAMRGGAERSRLASDRGGIEMLGERGNEEERYWARFAIRVVDMWHAEEARATSPASATSGTICPTPSRWAS